VGGNCGDDGTVKPEAQHCHPSLSSPFEDTGSQVTAALDSCGPNRVERIDAETRLPSKRQRASAFGDFAVRPELAEVV